MLRAGIIKLDNEEFNIFVIESKGFNRVDILRKGAEFQTDPDQVLYSHFGKKVLYEYGNKKLYERYQGIISWLEGAVGETTVETEWRDGSFFEKIEKGIGPEAVVTTTTRNSIKYSETYVRGADFVTLRTMNETYSDELEPLNSPAYSRSEVAILAEMVNSDIAYFSAPLLRAMFPLDWIDELDYHVVNTMEEFEDCMRRWEEYPDSEFTGFDFETTGLDVTYDCDIQIVGVVISPWEGTAWYFPFAHTTFDNLPLDLMYGRIFEVARNKKLVAHNKKYERKCHLLLAHLKLRQDPSFDFVDFVRHFKISEDSLILEFLINPVLVRGKHALKYLGYLVRNKVFVELTDIFKDRKNIDFRALDKETARIYVCPDGDNCRYIRESRYDKLPVYSRNLYKVENDLADITAEQEFYGVRVNSKALAAEREWALATEAKLGKFIQDLAKFDFKVTSGPQLSEVIYGKFKCPVYLRTKTGQPSTSAKALVKLGKQQLKTPRDKVFRDYYYPLKPGEEKPQIMIKGSDLQKAAYPIVLFIEKYREINKLITAFYNKIHRNSVNGRYYFWMNQNGTATGRRSSPMHQLPKSAKAHVQPDSEDHILFDSDYSQVELRLIFSLAGETELIELCRDPDNDIHRIIGQLITGKQMWEISAAERQKDKNRNFGTVYGISDKGLADQIYGPAHSKEERATCRAALLSFFNRFKRIKNYVDSNAKMALRTGKIETYFGRTRYFPELFDPTYPEDKKKGLLRQANNMPVQGTAADIMKLAEVRIQQYIENKGWDKLVDTPQGKFPLVRLMLSAHDEVLGSAHKSIPQYEILDMIKQCMELEIENFAPLFTSTCFVDCWLEGKKDEYQIPTGLRDKVIAEKSFAFTSDIKNQIATIIDKYRTDGLVGYMESLIKEHGVDNVWDFVRHSTLTHDLIARFPQSKESISERGYFSHIESIEYATKQYLKWRESNEGSLSVPVKTNEKAEEESIREAIVTEIGLVDALYDFDSEGNILYDDEEGGYLDEDDYFYNNDEVPAHELLPAGEQVYTWTMFDTQVVETDGLIRNEIDELIKLIYKQHNPSAYSKVYLHHGGSLYDTQAFCDNLEPKEIIEFIKSKIESRFVKV